MNGPELKRKEERYEQLVRARKACRACAGLTNPATTSYRRFDSNQIGPWSLWQGNLNSRLLIVGQDWGDTNYFQKWAGRDQPTGNPTNENLKFLLDHIGISIGGPRDDQEDKVFFTNLILCLKQGGLQAPVSDHWFSNCGQKFFVPLINIISPKAILALGKGASTTILRLFRVDINENQRLEKIMEHSPYELTASTVLFPLYHCGAGSVNRNRSLGDQMKDWEQVGDWIRRS